MQNQKIPLMLKHPTFKEIQEKFPNLSYDECLMYFDGYRDGLKDAMQIANSIEIVIKEN